MQTPAEQLNWKMGAINTSEFICLIHDCSYVFTSTWIDRQGSVRMRGIHRLGYGCCSLLLYYCYCTASTSNVDSALDLGDQLICLLLGVPVIRDSTMQCLNICQQSCSVFESDGRSASTARLTELVHELGYPEQNPWHIESHAGGDSRLWGAFGWYHQHLPAHVWVPNVPGALRKIYAGQGENGSQSFPPFLSACVSL